MSLLASGPIVGGQNNADVYGNRPKVPDFGSLSDVVGETAKANTLNFANISEMVRKTNELNLKSVEQMFPGFSQLSQSSQKVIADELGGKLPAGVGEEVSRNAAERGISGGWGADSGMGRSLEARDLGLTSFNLTQKGLDSAGRWMQFAENTSFRAENMFVTPAQGLQHNQDKFSADWLRAQVVAAPDPQARGEFDTDMAIGGMMLSAYGGGAGYTGAYRPSYGNGGGGSAGGAYNSGFAGGGHGGGAYQTGGNSVGYSSSSSLGNTGNFLSEG